MPTEENLHFFVVKMQCPQFNYSAKKQILPLLYVKDIAETVIQQIHHRFVRLKTFRLRNRPRIVGIPALLFWQLCMLNCIITLDMPGGFHYLKEFYVESFYD